VALDGVAKFIANTSAIITAAAMGQVPASP
jgi:hypothetical protein